MKRIVVDEFELNLFIKTIPWLRVLHQDFVDQGAYKVSKDIDKLVNEIREHIATKKQKKEKKNVNL